MGNKKSNYEKKPFESSRSSDFFAGLYSSMLESDVYKSLSATQKVLYTYCKLQYFGEKEKYKLKTEDHPHGHETFFTMNRSKWLHAYGLYSEKNQYGFQRDMSELIRKGFIVCVARGWHGKQKSIYAFSDKWQRYGTDSFTLSPNEMTSFMTGEAKKAWARKREAESAQDANDSE